MALSLLLRTEKLRLAFGTSLCFSSSFGQTFFLSLFTVELCTAFNVSSGTLGLVYGGATLLAGFALPVVGGLVDEKPAKTLGTISGLLLALGLALIAVAPHIAVVALGLFLARFLGQGFLSHLAGTYVARTFVVGRGSALGIAALGYPFGEAVLPSIFVAVLTQFGWRGALLAAAVAVAFVLVPVSRALIAGHDTNPVVDDGKPRAKKHGRFAVLKIKPMWFVIPFWVANPFVLTTLFFHQRTLGESLGLDAPGIAKAFFAFAIGRIVFGLLTGPVVDRFGAKRLFLTDLWPTMLGLVLLLVVKHEIAFPLYLLLAGMGVGFSGNVKTAYLAEGFGTDNLGAIKSSIVTFSVLATAVAAPISGVLLDNGATFAHVIAALLAYTIVSNVVAVIGVRQLAAADPSAS